MTAVAGPPVKYARVFAFQHSRAHFLLPGDRESLCGAAPRKGRSWLGGEPRAAERLALMPDCAICAARARFLADLDAWDGPAPRPGVVALVRRDGSGDRRAAGECARCGLLAPLAQRGLCRPCARACRKDGTIGEYGWLRPDRMGEFAALRRAGLSVERAAAGTGVCGRTGTRYEAALAAEGRATWRAAA